MLSGVYKWDREPGKAYIRKHGAEPPYDGLGESVRESPPPLRAALNPEAHGRILRPWQVRLLLKADGTWRLHHFDFELGDWIDWGAGEWSEEGSAVRLSMHQLRGAERVDPSPLILDVEGDRLLLGKELVGSFYGLVGFRLVSPLPEKGEG